MFDFFGMGKAQDRRIAQDYCDLIMKMREESKDDQLVARVVRKTLQEMERKHPNLKQEILYHLNDHQNSLFKIMGVTLNDQR